MTLIPQRPARHLRRATFGLIAAVMVCIAPSIASAATPAEAVAGLADGRYIEPGAENVDTAELAVVLEEGTEAGLDVTVIVLADPVDAVAFAGSVNDLVSGTVLVFTPDAYGVASTELGQATLDDALADAADDLSGPDVVAGVAAFVDAASPSNTNWGLIIVLAVIVVAAIGVGGRIIERRATHARRTAALRKEWGQLEARADLLASPILDLSTRVELDGSNTVADRYRIAAGTYGEIRDALAREPSADAVDEIQAGLDDLERRLDELEAALDAAKE